MNLKLTLPAGILPFGDTMLAIQEELQMFFQGATVESVPMGEGRATVAVLPGVAVLSAEDFANVEVAVLQGLLAVGAIHFAEDAPESLNVNEVQVQVEVL